MTAERNMIRGCCAIIFTVLSEVDIHFCLDQGSFADEFQLAPISYRSKYGCHDCFGTYWVILHARLSKRKYLTL